MAGLWIELSPKQDEIKIDGKRLISQGDRVVYAPFGSHKKARIGTVVKIARYAPKALVAWSDCKPAKWVSVFDLKIVKQ